MRQAGSIFSLICAGFFLYIIEVTAFFKPPEQVQEGTAFLLIGGIFAVPFLFFLTVGLALRSFRYWSRFIGIVILSTNGALAFMALTFVCMFNSPAAMAAVPPETVSRLELAYSNWPLGVVVFGLVTVLGVILTILERRAA